MTHVAVRKISLVAFAFVGLMSSTFNAFAASRISAIWANEGGDKVVREECRQTNGANTRTAAWTGSKVKVWGAKNEVVSFNLIIEACDGVGAQNVAVAFNRLTGPNGAVIGSVPVAQTKLADGVFDWTERNIELFYVRYHKIEGLSALSYQHYDERHIPLKMRRPWRGAGEGYGVWTDRPNADKNYPEIAVPLEVVPKFNIAANENQSIWADIYIPRYAEAGVYNGTLTVTELDGLRSFEVPVELTVRNFSLPEEPTAKTMLFLGYEDVNLRYLNKQIPKSGSPNERLSKIIRDRHFQVAHRHKISLIDKDFGSRGWEGDSPRWDWIARLDGSLFSPVNGYEGPGAFTGNNVYAIGAYSSWSWKKDDDELSMREHTDNWVKWFKQHFPQTETFLYLIDESSDFLETEKWARWVRTNPGIGHELRTFATVSLPEALAHIPDLSISASWLSLGVKDTWETAVAQVKSDPNKLFYAYNGKRPGSGSFATEDDGIALRELAWGQYKRSVDRWFYWESTYYSDFQSERGHNNLFRDAHTIGRFSKVDSVFGKTGYNYSNGDGVLFYPGTDMIYPQDSYGLRGPIASLRLKHWRRGIQDVDYLNMAAGIDPVTVKYIVDTMIPKVMWENNVDNLEDPTYVHTDISWPTDPSVWENARAQLADIIEHAPRSETGFKK